MGIIELIKECRGMNRLFDSMAGGSQGELFNVVQQGLQNALEGKSDQFFYNIDVYLSHAPNAMQDMVVNGRNRLQDLAQQNGWKKQDEMFDQTTEDYFAIFSTLENYVCVGVDMEKEGFPPALFTRNIGILENLASKGQLEGDVTKLIDQLTKNKTEKALKEGNFVTVRLDLVDENNGNPIFKGVVPRSNMDIGANKQFVIIPVPFYYIFENMLEQKFRDKPFRFTKSSVIGQVSYNSAIGKDIVRNVYAGCDGNLVESKVNKFKPRYDVTKQRYFVHDLESSLTSLGIATFRPEMLDEVKEISIQDIDTSKHNVNFTLLRGIYKTRINQAKSDQLDSLNLLDLSSYANMKDKTEALIQLGEDKTEKDLYAIMKSNPDVFGDIGEGLQKRERTTPKFMKTFKSVSLPTSLQERKDAIEDMMSKGVVRFTATKKKGGIFERYGTNNPQVLERMLGKEYVKNFESIRNKLYHVKDLIEKGEVTKKVDLEKVGVEFNILDYLDVTLYFSGNPIDAVETIDNAIETLKQKSASRTLAEGAILYRDIYATDTKDFFGSVNANNIMAVDFSEVK